jgi:adenylate kinase
MTRDDIIRMAREAGLCDSSGEDDDSVNIVDHLERFAALVAAAEREALIDIVAMHNSSVEIEAAIRARRNT